MSIAGSGDGCSVFQPALRKTWGNRPARDSRNSARPGDKSSSRPHQVCIVSDAVVPERVTVSSPSWRRKTDMIIGDSPAIRQLLHALDRLAPATTPVLITGESGVGKELVARSLHYAG